MKKNYQAWDIDFNDFYNQEADYDKLHFLLKFAVLAPSTHNSQPWKFAIRNNSILIFADLTRKLSISDSSNRYLFFSIGCAVQNILTAAEYYNLNPKIHYFPHSESGQYANLTAKITFENLSRIHKNEDHTHAIFSIPKRRTNRNEYYAKIPDKTFLSWLSNLQVPQAKIHIIQDPAQKNAIADMMMESRIAAFDNKPFRHELASYKRTNLTRSSTGIPGFAMGFNLLISLIAPIAIRHFNVMKPLRKKEELLLKKHTPLFIVISMQNDAQIDWIRAGQLFEQIVLEAQRYDIQTAISAIPSDIKLLQTILKTTYYPQIFLRLGYAKKKSSPTPRFEAQDTLSKY